MAAGKVSRGVVKDIIIVVVGVLIIWFGLKMVTGTDNPFYVVSSGSMIPVLEVYDVLVVDGKIPFEEVEVGDIIVFNRPSGHDRVIVHRVAAIIDENPFTIRTKGDANPASIPGTDFPITEEEYIGKVWQVVPQVGYITRIMQPPVNYIIIAIIIGVMIFKQISKSKKDKEIRLKSLNEERNDAEISTIDPDELNKIPKDDVYTNLGVENEKNEQKESKDELLDKKYTESKNNNESKSNDSEKE